MSLLKLEDVKSLPWFQDLRSEVERCCAEQQTHAPDTAHSLQRQLAKIDEQCRGWAQSLGNPALSTNVRSELEQLIDNSRKETETIQRQLSDLESLAKLARQPLDPENIIERLNRLPEILQANCPSRGNIELAGYIDSITCHPSGKIDLRIFKLGALDKYDPQASQLLDLLQSTSSALAAPAPTSSPAAGATEPAAHATSEGVIAGKPQIRKRRRFTPLSGEDMIETTERSEALMEPDRFAVFGPDLFWTDELHIPIKQRWHEVHAHEVARAKAQDKTYEEVCKHFGKSKPTILEALRYAKANPLPAAKTPDVK